MAKTFELNPGFPSGAAKVLEARGKRIKEKELNFNYKRYAYIYLTSAPSAPEAPKDSDGDSISLFDLYEKKGLTIGIPPSGGHLSLYDIENGKRRLKPQITSVTMNQSGGGDVLHYYMMLDCIVTPILLAMRTGYQRRTRSKKLKNAVCQEQLNQVHTGIELDYMLEYSLSLVCPAMSIVLCQGLPMLPSK